MHDIVSLVQAQHDFFITQKTKPMAFRMESLRALSGWISANEDAILHALSQDLGKHPCEGYLTEIAIVKQELKDAIRHLQKWMKPRRVPTAIGQIPGKAFVLSEPYGAALIMSPWNYPFQLSIAPLIGAVAAGNCVTLKPSAYSPATSALLGRMAEELFPPEYLAVIQGGRAENAALLEQAFDYIFFTGSSEVGKLVMEKASRHLTPVSLELGGKSPCIVTETADLALAAKRIAWGKFLNSGQTCVAPDYVLVDESKEQALLDELIKALRKLYGDAPLENPEYPRIVNAKHFQRLTALLGSGVVSHGGQLSEASLRISPTLLTDVSWDSPVMQEEIFGPILPILSYRRLEEAIQRIQSRPKPLALYLFTQSPDVQGKVLGEVSFGGGCVNDAVLHLATHHMPFGGVGESGMGRYHGKDSFDTFSHQKSILKSATWVDLPLRYPPYGDKLKWLRKII